MKITLKRRGYTLIYHSKPRSIEVQTFHSHEQMNLLELIHRSNLCKLNSPQHQMYTEAIQFYTTCTTKYLSVVILLWPDAKFEDE